MVAAAGGIQSIAGQPFASRWKALFRSAPNQASDLVAPAQQFRRKPPSDKAGRAGEEDVCHRLRYGKHRRDGFSWVFGGRFDGV